MIRLNNIDKYYNKGRQNELHVLDHVSLELPDKGMVAIFGRSGCGKTTLLNAIGGLDKTDSGSITLDGGDIRENTDTLRNRMVGYIFQNYNLNKEETVFDNVADALRLIGIKDEAVIEDRVQKALANVDMLRFRRRLPDTLSGGQQQRVAIARAIVKNPPVILADEPTGNLDEANTIQVMDLLRQIAADRLVVLVTHEAYLVDYYCDTVVELADGKVVNIRRNENAEGFSGRRRTDIYLGELPGRRENDGYTDIRFYGDRPEMPLKLTVVRENGKTYLRVDTPGVDILEANSEVRLKEGFFEQEEQKRAQTARVDMSGLPPIEGTRFGRLYTLKNSLKAAFSANFAEKKKGQKLLRRVMILFAAIMVLSASLFGTSVRDLKKVEGSYSRNMFYLLLPNSRIMEQLKAAEKDPSSCIDELRLSPQDRAGDDEIEFTIGFFETFSRGFDIFESDFKTNAVFRNIEGAEDLKLAAGRKTGLQDNELLLTTAAADSLLQRSTVDYVKHYEDILGFASYDIGGKNLKLAGIVESDERAVFLKPMAMARYILNEMYRLWVVPASDVGRELKDGEAILAVNYDTGLPLPEKGSEVLLHGMTFAVADKVDLREAGADNSDFFVLKGSGEWTYYEPICYQDQFYLVSDADYVRLAYSYGNTDPTGGYTEDIAVGEDGRFILNEEGYIWNIWYAAVHSSEPEKTAAYLKERFGDLDSGLDYKPAMVTPEDLRDELMTDSRASIAAGITGMVIMLALLSLCMYFIMRASLMSRVKEVGIDRAIGVSRGNLLLRFFTEAFVLCTLTVFIGYLISSVIVGFWLASSPLMASTFYYPLWLALLVLAVLYVISLICGVLPVILLLRKTPSEILAKYDI